MLKQDVSQKPIHTDHSAMPRKVRNDSVDGLNVHSKFLGNSAITKKREKNKNVTPGSCPAQDRPRSAVDQTGFGEREVGRTRMSVEEQLERMRRNQQASSLREKKRETPSRSPSFCKDNPFLVLQVKSLSHTH